jgi:hypothetical protein
MIGEGCVGVWVTQGNIEDTREADNDEDIEFLPLSEEEQDFNASKA